MLPVFGKNAQYKILLRGLASEIQAYAAYIGGVGWAQRIGDRCGCRCDDCRISTVLEICAVLQSIETSQSESSCKLFRYVV